VDSIARAPRPFQGHYEVRVEGRWRKAESTPSTGMLLVPISRANAPLVMYLLDPESDDAFATWNLLDASLRVGRPHPVLRITEVNGGGR
jgi:hypothetical protein